MITNYEQSNWHKLEKYLVAFERLWWERLIWFLAGVVVVIAIDHIGWYNLLFYF